MKKNLLKKLAVLFLAFLFTSTSIAQSDYEIVQDFKAKYQEIEKQIKDTLSLEELNTVVAMIDQLKQEFNVHKELLDKSLYPDNYNKSIEKLMLMY